MKLKDGSATLEDVRRFCKDVLFPQLVLGAYMFWYSDWRQNYGAKGVQGAASEGWERFRTEGWNVAACVRTCMSDVFGVRCVSGDAI